MTARDDLIAVWEYDEEGCTGCMCGSDDCPCFTGEPHETEGCTVYLLADVEDYERESHAAPKRRPMPLTSLWSICGATREYRCEVESELLDEALDTLRQEAAERPDDARAITVMIPA